MIGVLCSAVNEVFRGGVCVVVFYAMAQLQTRELTLAGHVAHILAGRGEQRHPTLRQLFGLSLREMVVLSW